MFASQIYIAIMILVLGVIFGLFILLPGKASKKLSPMAGLALGFILAGMIFNEDAMTAYSLIGAGVILSIVDMFYKIKENRNANRA